MAACRTETIQLFVHVSPASGNEPDDASFICAQQSVAENGETLHMVFVPLSNGKRGGASERDSRVGRVLFVVKESEYGKWK